MNVMVFVVCLIPFLITFSFLILFFFFFGCDVGSLLLKHALSVALEDPNIEEAYLHVQTNNQGAIRFYEREGFEVREMIKNYYKRIDPPDCYILHKWLVTPPAASAPAALHQ